MKQIDGATAKKLREKLGMNQSQFWSAVGCTQSGGSRYESGRAVPRPVQSLIPIVHLDTKQALAAFTRLRKAAA